jgi:hypothetical protein
MEYRASIKKHFGWLFGILKVANNRNVTTAGGRAQAAGNQQSNEQMTPVGQVSYVTMRHISEARMQAQRNSQGWGRIRMNLAYI